MTAQTSLLAYQQMIASNQLSPARSAIVSALEEMGIPLTRWEISKYLEMSNSKYHRINSVCGRVNELVKLGVILEDGDTKKCSVTFNTAKTLRLSK